MEKPVRYPKGLVKHIPGCGWRLLIKGENGNADTLADIVTWEVFKIIHSPMFHSISVQPVLMTLDGFGTEPYEPKMDDVYLLPGQTTPVWEID